MERLDAADVVGAIALVAGLGARDDLDAVGIAAPAAARFLCILLERLLPLHRRLPGQIDMPVLPGAGAAYDVEAREIAAVTAAPAMAGVGNRRYDGSLSRSSVDTRVRAPGCRPPDVGPRT